MRRMFQAYKEFWQFRENAHLPATRFEFWSASIINFFISNILAIPLYLVLLDKIWANSYTEELVKLVATSFLPLLFSVITFPSSIVISIRRIKDAGKSLSYYKGLWACLGIMLALFLLLSFLGQALFWKMSDAVIEKILNIFLIAEVICSLVSASCGIACFVYYLSPSVKNQRILR